MTVRPFASRRRLLGIAVLLLGVAWTGLAADGPSRPASGTRPRKSAPRAPAIPPPRPGEWTTQTGSPAAPAPRSPDATTSPAPEATPPAPEAPPPPAAPPDPLFDDRPTGYFEPITWKHRPSPQVVSSESSTEEACSRLLQDDTLPPGARAALLGGRARARMRMWQLAAAREDIEAAVALDARAAPLYLVQAEVLACFGETDAADSVVQKAVEFDPESTFSARVLGLIRFQQGSMQSAADALALHLDRSRSTGIATGDATLPLLRAVAAGDMSGLDPAEHADNPWPAQLAAFLRHRIDRATLLERARRPKGAAPDEAACTAWFYLGQRSLAEKDADRARLDLLAAVRTGSTAMPEYRLAVAALIRLGVLKADSLPGQLAP